LATWRTATACISPCSSACLTIFFSRRRQ
jgi:hypothetical protein